MTTLPKRDPTFAGTLAIVLVLILFFISGSVVSRKVGASPDTHANAIHEKYLGE